MGGGESLPGFHRNERGILSAEDDAAYTRMEQEITDLGKEIARMERQEAFERELSQPVNTPLTGRPASGGAGKEKTGRASEEYRTNFWNAMRSKVPLPVWSTLWRKGRIPRAGTWCRMSMSVPWWKPWKRKTCSASWQT